METDGQEMESEREREREREEEEEGGRSTSEVEGARWEANKNDQMHFRNHGTTISSTRRETVLWRY